MLKAFMHKEEGSFSLEASLIFPMILLVIFVMLFFCMYLYQKSVLVQVASTAAERAAYSWDNSYKEPRTGAFAEGEHDSLYWRLKDDIMLGALFGWAGASNRQSLIIPRNGADESLSARKLSQAQDGIPAGIQGDISYENSLISRKVTTNLNKIVHIPILNNFLDETDLNGRIGSGVVEPVEWIRTIELMRYYGAKFMGASNGEPTDPSVVRKVLETYSQAER